MARKRLGFKPSLREARLASNSAQSFYASGMALDDPRRAEAQERLAQERDAIAPVRTQGPRRDLEGPVVAAIAELLAVHPKVAFACRQNSGQASYEAKSGKYAPVAFYRILTGAKELTVVDFWGFLKDGRIIAVEAKAPGFTAPRNDREYKQANFLALVRNCGGIGIFATSADDVAIALR